MQSFGAIVTRKFCSLWQDPFPSPALLTVDVIDGALDFCLCQQLFVGVSFFFGNTVILQKQSLSWFLRLNKRFPTSIFKSQMPGVRKMVYLDPLEFRISTRQCLLCARHQVTHAWQGWRRWATAPGTLWKGLLVYCGKHYVAPLDIAIFLQMEFSGILALSLHSV